MEGEKGTLQEAILSAMRKQSISPDGLEASSGVSERHIKAIIEGNYEELPAAPYVRGYLLKIAEILELEGEALWKNFVERSEDLKKSGKEDRLPENRYKTRRLGMRLLVLVAIIILIIIGAVIRTLGLDNPKLEFTNLEEGSTTVERSQFIVRGALNPKYKLTLGKSEVVLEEDGSFTKEVGLEPGRNAFIFTAKKVLGKDHKFPVEIFYREPEFPIEEIEPVISNTTSTQLVPAQDGVIE